MDSDSIHGNECSSASFVCGAAYLTTG